MAKEKDEKDEKDLLSKVSWLAQQAYENINTLNQLTNNAEKATNQFGKTVTKSDRQTLASAGIGVLSAVASALLLPLPQNLLAPPAIGSGAGLIAAALIPKREEEKKLRRRLEIEKLIEDTTLKLQDSIALGLKDRTQQLEKKLKELDKLQIDLLILNTEKPVGQVPPSENASSSAPALPSSDTSE